MKGYILYADYDTIDDKTQVELYGKLENNQSFACVINVKPYFYIKSSDVKKAGKLLEKWKVEETNLKTFKGEKVAKLLHSSQTELNKLSKALHHKEIDTFEADVKPDSRFLMDNNILSSLNIEGEYELSDRVDRVYKNPAIKFAFFRPELKIISLDIESGKDNSGGLYCIGLYGKNYKKNFIVSDKKLPNAVSCKTESECLEKFRSEMHKIDPDIITGWNMIDFDLVFLQEKFRENKIPFDIGRSNKPVRLRIESSFFRNSSADVSGRQIVDALNMIQDPFIQEAPSIKYAKFDSYTLENVSQVILGEGKLIKGKDRHKEISELYKKDPQKLVDYNLQDCKLAYDILEKTKMIDLAMERSELTGLQFDRLTASIAAFDSLYIREANVSGLVSPTNSFTEKERRLTGGYVKEANSGIYHNILVLDFKSLYPSILKTFNIDPSSYIGEKAEKGAIETPNKVYFRNSTGVLPKIIDRLHKSRELAKKEGRELSSYAIKIIMNSFWGVLASPNCRYFDFNLASSITSFARFIIQLTAKEIESKGFKVIYSDTDSVFVETSLSKEKANELGKKIENDINNFYKEYVTEKYSRTSYLELQFEKQYIVFLIPKIRKEAKEGEEEKGAKKRYAGLIEKNGKEEVIIVGLEAMRGDWVLAAREFQRELIWKLFHNEPIEIYIKDYIKKIKAGKLDEKLVYTKSIRKNLDEYTKTTPPHVKAARKLEHLESNIIQYYITLDGPEPIQKLKHKLDYEHYIKKQIEPIASQILELLNKKFEEIAKTNSQTNLF